eukprot:2744383-Prymnesium_polylepis.1
MMRIRERQCKRLRIYIRPFGVYVPEFSCMTKCGGKGLCVQLDDDFAFGLAVCEDRACQLASEQAWMLRWWAITRLQRVHNALPAKRDLLLDQAAD